jgi:hypothetical protein
MYIVSEVFLENFPITKTQIELEELQGNFPQYSAEYVTSASIKERREWIESLWQICENDVENNFTTELATKGRFNQKTWELFINCFLKKNNLKLLRRTGEGPDFSVEINSKIIWIEATAPSIGEVDSAPERPNIEPGEIYTGGGDIETTYRTKILRFVSAVRNKSNKVVASQYYKGRLSSLIKENDCYVIAINGYDFSGLVADPIFLLRRSLLSAGCMSYRMLSDRSLAPGKYLHKPTVIKNKPDGSQEEIPTDIFTNDKYSEISAIIYSPEHIINTMGDINKLGNYLYLVKNPFAKNPIPKNFPSCRVEIVSEGNSITEIVNPTD